MGPSCSFIIIYVRLQNFGAKSTCEDEGRAAAGLQFTPIINCSDFISVARLERCERGRREIILKRKIHIKKIWFDNDVIELKIEVSDGDSTFSNKVYVGHSNIEEVVKDLNNFRKSIYGGIYDITFGAFSPEYAKGGFQARLHFYAPGKLNISTYQQSDHKEFSKRQVASEARLYLSTGPALLDNFIAEISSLSAGNKEEANLKCI